MGPLRRSALHGDPERIDPLGGLDARLLGPVAGIIGSLQALEAIRVLFTPERARGGCMKIFQLKDPRWRSVDFAPRPGCACATAVASGLEAGKLESERLGQRRQDAWLS